MFWACFDNIGHTRSFTEVKNVRVNCLLGWRERPLIEHEKVQPCGSQAVACGGNWSVPDGERLHSPIRRKPPGFGSCVLRPKGAIHLGAKYLGYQVAPPVMAGPFTFLGRRRINRGRGGVCLFR